MPSSVPQLKRTVAFQSTNSPPNHADVLECVLYVIGSDSVGDFGYRKDAGVTARSSNAGKALKKNTSRRQVDGTVIISTGQN